MILIIGTKLVRHIHQQPSCGKDFQAKHFYYPVPSQRITHEPYCKVANSPPRHTNRLSEGRQLQSLDPQQEERKKERKKEMRP
jgi:hypothetical protein